MRKINCNLCIRHYIKSGKDKLLHEDYFCYIVNNGNTHLDIDGKMMFAKKRISLIIKNHKKNLTQKEKNLVNYTLADFMRKKFKLRKNRNYFLKTTMGTHPDHYHIHAYIPPFTEKGRIK